MYEATKTLVDEFAMAAMQGDWAANYPMLSHGFETPDEDLLEASIFYYRMGRAMMKARAMKEDE